jgi:hypothetical protein
VRSGEDGQAEFYDRQTGETFVPRGINHINLLPSNGRLEDCIFRVGDYDPAGLQAMFETLASYGYNTVRLFLDSCNTQGSGMGNSSGQGLNGVYLDNLADGIHLARAAGIYLLLTSNDLPNHGGYWAISDQGISDQFGGYRNAHYLTAPGVEAAVAYWTDLLTGLIERGAPLDTVLGWQLLNEQWYFNNDAPLNLESGMVTTANGQSYDMASEAQKRQMLADSMIYYMEAVSAAIRDLDPTALITMGFFSTPGGGTFNEAIDFRYVDTADLLGRAPLDFFDFHAYPGDAGVTLSEIAEDFGMVGFEAKPIILGEYGGFQDRYDSANSAARAMAAWMAASCEAGFDGWLYWTYAPAPLVVGDSAYGFISDENLIMEALAPSLQPDPCAIEPPPSANLALGQPVRVSRALGEEPGAYAVDESLNTQWGSGANAPQWIQVELPAGAVVGHIRLLVAQYPAGDTLHRVYAYFADGSHELVAEFSGPTSDNDWLEAEFDPPLEGVTAIRVETLSSPSWVSWKQIEVLAP